MAKTAQAIMEDIKSKESAFTSATHVEYVRLMFKVREMLPWYPVPRFAMITIALCVTLEYGLDS